MSKKPISANAQKVLARLRQGRASSRDLNAVCFRYSARILELRQAGYDIETKKVGDNFCYRLVEVKSTTPVNARPVLPGMFS